MRHTKILAVIAAAITCVIAAGQPVHAGDVYKYVDAHGATLYTDKPIPGAVLVKTTSPRPPEVAARSYAASQAATNSQLSASNQRIAEAQNDTHVAANVAKDLEASRAERCKKARETYTTSINSQRLYRQAPDGKREYLTDAEIAQQRLESAKAVDAICGPQG
jgi:hypothetical protein